MTGAGGDGRGARITSAYMNTRDGLIHVNTSATAGRTADRPCIYPTHVGRSCARGEGDVSPSVCFPSQGCHAGSQHAIRVRHRGRVAGRSRRRINANDSAAAVAAAVAAAAAVACLTLHNGEPEPDRRRRRDGRGGRGRVSSGLKRSLRTALMMRMSMRMTMMRVACGLCRPRPCSSRDR